MKIDAYYYDAVDLLKQLISTPSLSREEEVAADLLEKSIRDFGFQPARKGNNVWISSSPWDESKPTILLNSHIDTVKPVTGWTKDPFSPTEDGDCLFGLGSNDAGASVVSLLTTFRLLSNKEQAYNLIFLASCEEEVSGKNGVELALAELPKIDFALVGEPTGMQPAIAERGLMVLDCVVRGRSGHAARNEGENAIYKALPAISWFRQASFPKRSDLLGEVKATVTMIGAGTQHNVIPDECRFTVDVRSNELYTNEELFAMIKEQVDGEVTARSFRLNSSRMDINHPFVKRLQLLEAVPFGSPTLSDQALMSFPSLKMGPGASSRSHSADEFILLSEIREAIELYYRTLNDFAF
ncbi:M20 family metallo-hydrolase [Bacteroidales bacterium OttesenSCG-928-L03]|nr:M20 family metallo-hydrolase [Bacteroidales bacterium OttesenSCG-928-L03]